MALSSTDLSQINDIVSQAVTRATSGLATKADIDGMATKADLDGMATKADLEAMATKIDLDRMEGRLTTAINLLQRDQHEARISKLEQAAKI